MEARIEDVTKLLPHSLAEIVGVMGVAEVIERLPPPPPGIPPSLTEEMGMEMLSKDSSSHLDKSETSAASSTSYLGGRRATNIGISKTTGSTTGKDKKKRPLSVTLPLNPLPQEGSQDMQLPPPVGISQSNSIGGETLSPRYSSFNKEIPKGHRR